jgi:hypothetical protein
VARIFKFLDILGSELHTINDPEEKLPIPAIRQVISIGKWKDASSIRGGRYKQSYGLQCPRKSGPREQLTVIVSLVVHEPAFNPSRRNSPSTCFKNS